MTIDWEPPAQDGRDRCEFCGQLGSFDLTEPPASFHKQGRRNQGAMTPCWAPAEYSPTLDKVCCPRCFKTYFYKAAGRARRAAA